jgi:hypothetical protein
MAESGVFRVTPVRSTFDGQSFRYGLAGDVLTVGALQGQDPLEQLRSIKTAWGTASRFVTRRGQRRQMPEASRGSDLRGYRRRTFQVEAAAGMFPDELER